MMKTRTTNLGNSRLVTTKKRLTSLGSGVLLVAAFFGASCDDAEIEIEPQDGEQNELGVNFEELGTPITPCTAADSTSPATGYDAAAKTLHVSLASFTTADVVISVVGTKLKMNGYACKTAPIAAVVGPPAVAAIAALELTSTNVTKIDITGATSTNKIVIDLLPGSFGNIFSATGGITVTGVPSIGIRGSTAANLVKMGQEGTSAGGPYYVELSGDVKPDLRIVGQPQNLNIALGDGNDTFAAQGPTAIMVTTALGGSTPTGDVEDLAVTVFGGAGLDSLKGGLGADTLNGGLGNDVFTTGAVADGADVYIGAEGTDVVDYSARTADLNVSIAPTYTSGWVEGNSLFGKTVASAQTITYSFGTVGQTVAGTMAFAANATTPAQIVAALNLDGNHTPSPAPFTASLNDRNELVLVRKIAGRLVIATDVATDIFGTVLSNDGVAQLPVDNDDGATAEADDVRADIENLIGGSGNDTLTGGTGTSNTLTGGAGNDNISGGTANATCSLDVDVLNGNDGDDVFEMGAAANCGDAIDGGLGRDVASYQMRLAATSLVIDIDAQADDGEAAEADTVKAGVEIILGGAGNDSITGGADNDDLHGGLGLDTLVGGAGNDSFSGGPGADLLLGGLGEDYFNEKDIPDVYTNSGNAPGNTVQAFSLAAFGAAGVVPSTIGSAEVDVINGGADFDICDYGRTVTTNMTVTLCFAPTITTATGACTGGANAPNNDTADTDDITNCDNFVAGAGNDTITGSDGDDEIQGGLGNDVLSGGEGGDTLQGEGGTNTLTGGGGDDNCSVGTAGTKDDTCEF
jgi:Ca2+-binding RTX toxin-like protein